MLLEEGHRVRILRRHRRAVEIQARWHQALRHHAEIIVERMVRAAHPEHHPQIIFRETPRRLIRLVLEPSAVASLVSGELSRNKVQEGPSELAQSVELKPVPEERVPFMLLRAMRVFCVQRKSAVGLYAFHQANEATGSFPENDLRVVLWMRSPDHAFYNDFCMMAERMMPPRLDFYCAAVTAEDADTVAFLQQHRPLWPITKK